MGFTAFSKHILTYNTIIDVIQFWASIVPMISMIKWQCHSCYCYYYYYYCYYHYFILLLLLSLFLLSLSWCAVLMNTPGLRDPVVMRVLSDFLVCDLNRIPIVMAKHGGSCVHFSGISTCGRTSPETVSHPQRQPLPTPSKISLSVYVIVTNKRLQPLTIILYILLVLSFSLLKS